jgi:hypothetical protein
MFAVALALATCVLGATGAASSEQLGVAPDLQVTCRSWSLLGEPVDISIRIAGANGSASEFATARIALKLGGSAAFLPVDPMNGRFAENPSPRSLILEPERGQARVLFSDAVPESIQIEISYEDEKVAPAVPIVVGISFLDPEGDDDRDGVSNLKERQLESNPYAIDSDADGCLDSDDNCAATANPGQSNAVHPGGFGDACDDPDKDGVADAWDNCPDAVNPEQFDTDGDGIGNDCQLPPSAPADTSTFSLPFLVTDAVFDPIRPYLYVSQKASKKVYFVNLQTGFVEQEFSFTTMPESLALTPDGSRLFVALLTRDHSSYWWDGDHEGFIASFDLAARVKDREFHITEDPYDLVATSNGHLVVSSGSGQWTYMRAFDAVTGAETGAAANVRHQSRLTLHPSESRVYAANTDLSPSDIERYDLSPSGGLVRRWDSPYHGNHRMSGNVWASPLGDILITRGGDVFAVGATQATDMQYISGLSTGSITDLAWDVTHPTIFTIESAAVRLYDLATRALIKSYALTASGRFVGSREGDIYALVPSGQTTRVEVFTRRPAAVAGVDQSVECESASSAHVALSGAASTDPDSTPGTHDDIVSFQWLELAADGSRTLRAQGETVTLALGLGSHHIILRVVDRLGHWGEDDVSVVVLDTVPPTLDVSVTPGLLWPADHRWVDVTASVTATDSCSGTSWTLVSVTSSEPEHHLAATDPNLGADIRDDEPGTADVFFGLRAERAGPGGDRVYTALYEASDAAGNVVRRAAHVVVPHDQGAGSPPLDIRIRQSANATIVTWTAGTETLPHDVIRGSIRNLRESGGVIDLGSVVCIASGVSSANAVAVDSSIPPPGASYFYLVDSNDGVSRSWGSGSREQTRAPAWGSCAR